MSAIPVFEMLQKALSRFEAYSLTGQEKCGSLVRYPQLFQYLLTQAKTQASQSMVYGFRWKFQSLWGLIPLRNKSN